VLLSLEREFLLGYLHLGYILQALIADFKLSKGIYSHVKIKDIDSVCLWLGANVMLEYTCGFSLVLLFSKILQANTLLIKNLENVKGRSPYW
jgi:hypothetical protein